MYMYEYRGYDADILKLCRDAACWFDWERLIPGRERIRILYFSLKLYFRT